MNSQEDSVDKFSVPVRYLTSFGKDAENNIWDEYAELVIEHKPVNLGAGYQDFPVPDHVTKALINIASGDDYSLHQYTHDQGHPRLVKVLSKLYSQLTGQEVNPMSEILVTSGAYEALYCSIEGHISPGDEVIIIEPFYPCFETMVKCAGGIPVFVELHPVKPVVNTLTSNSWLLDPVELASKFNSRTKAIILNTPHNPLGKVFSLEELSMIADLCKKWNVLCISDEVYEFITYNPNEHIRIATLTGMWERTITIGSAGKLFGVTGWKIGWAYGSAAVMRNLIVVHLNSIFTIPTPLQEAIAQALELELTRLGKPDSYLQNLTQELEVKRDFVVKFLSDAGMVPIVPDGGYFMLANWSSYEPNLNLLHGNVDCKDIQFTKWLIKCLKIFCLPSSLYYSDSKKQVGEQYIRLCFIKILQALVPPLQLTETDSILETFATYTMMMSKQEATVLRAFLQALVDAVLTSHGEILFTDLPIVYTDRIWSTIRCGITTMKNVISYFGSLRPKTDSVDYSQIPDCNQASTSLSIIPSKGSNISTSSTTVRGTVVIAAVPASTTINVSTPIENLLALAKCRLQTGSASSHIYVQDADASYKYELTSRPGDTLLDLRVYPLEKTISEEPMNWWHYSSFRGQIVVNSGSNNFSRASDPVFQKLQVLIAEIQTLFANAEQTQITRQRSRR